MLGGVKSGALLAILLALVCANVDAATRSRPNILFIMTDDHAARAISAYGKSIATKDSDETQRRTGAPEEKNDGRRPLCE